MIARLKQPDSTGACCCRDDCGPCASGPTVTAGACVSRTGTGYLRGVSKFDNFNSGDVNLRKYIRATASGNGPVCTSWYSGANCAGYIGDSLFLLQSDNAIVWDVGTNSASERAKLYYKICENLSVYHTITNPLDGKLKDLVGCAITSPAGVAQSDTRWAYVASAVLAGACQNTPFPNGCGAVATYKNPPSDLPDGNAAYWDLSEPDTVAAAIARRSDPEPGTLCKTTAATIGSTTAGSTSQISLEATSVSVPLTAAGLTASTDYELTIPIERYTAAGGAYVDTINETVLFTAAGATEDIDYEVPVNTDYDYKYAGGVTIAAA